MGKSVEILGWILNRRKTKLRIFLHVTDSTGIIRIVASQENIPSEDYEKIARLPKETAVRVAGTVSKAPDGALEVTAHTIKLVGKAHKHLSPSPRSSFPIFDERFSDHVLRNRHLYLRNPKMMAVLRFKNAFLYEIHRYFQEKEFVFIDAPVLTQLLLYEDTSAFHLAYDRPGARSSNVFLSQCCTFYLEAAILAFERVYNLTPSFRAEHSRSDRHLREYWHLKVEIAWANLDDLIELASDALFTVTCGTFGRCDREINILGQVVDLSLLEPPYPIVTYEDAVNILCHHGCQFEWGKNLSTAEEEILTHEFGDRLLWVKGIPCKAEPFPFAKDEQDPRYTRTCDLIAPGKFGELLSSAEKITERQELIDRMEEKGRTTPDDLQRYQWYIDLHDYGMVPHGGIGMGIERIVRYVLQLPHARDAISFPRVYGRHPNP